MSWNAYSDALVGYAQGSADVGGAALGYDGAQWAGTNLTMSADEWKTLQGRFGNPNTGAKIVAGGVSYMALACDGEVLNGKKGDLSFCAVKCAKCIVVGVTGSGGNAGSLNQHCQTLADDLKGKGF